MIHVRSETLEYSETHRSGGHFDGEIKPADKPTTSVALQGSVSIGSRGNTFCFHSSFQPKGPRPKVVAVQVVSRPFVTTEQKTAAFLH